MSRAAYSITSISVIFFFALVAYLCNTAEFRMKHPRYPDAVIKVTANGAIVQKEIQLASHRIVDGSPSVPSLPSGPPHAEFLEQMHDFDYMDPQTDGRHTFVVRNTGGGFLDVQVKDTTCKCTVAGAKDRIVSPGGETTVELSWNTGKQPLFSQSATISTNDPELPEVLLKVQGKVRRRLACSPDVLAIGGISPGEKAAANTIVYSQVWEQFEIADLKSQSLGMILSTEQLASDQIPPELEAKCAYRLFAQAPPSFSVQGAFQDVITVHVADLESDAEETLSIPLQGRVLRAFSLYGPAIQETGEIDMGLLTRFVGGEANLMVKIRDDQKDLGAIRIESSVPYLSATLIPRSGGKELGLYTLALKVAPDAPKCNHFSDKLRALLTIQTEHPRIGKQVFPVRFAVD